MKNIMSRLTSALIAGAVTVSITAFPAMAEEKENFIGVEPLYLESYFTSITHDNYAVLTDTNNFYPGGNNRYILVLDYEGDMHLVHGRITDTLVKTSENFDPDSFMKNSDVKVTLTKQSDTEYIIKDGISADDFADIVDKLENTPEVTWIENHYTVYEDTANHVGDYRFYFTDDVTPEYINKHYSQLDLEYGGELNYKAEYSFISKKYSFSMLYDPIKKSSTENENGFQAEKNGLKTDFFYLRSLAGCEICDLECAVTELACLTRDVHYCTDILYDGGYNHNNKDYDKLTLDNARNALFGESFFLSDIEPLFSSISNKSTLTSYNKLGKTNMMEMQIMRARIKVADGYSLDIDSLAEKAGTSGYVFRNMTKKGNEYIITSTNYEAVNDVFELLKADSRVLSITTDLRIIPDYANYFSLYGFKFDGTRPQEEIIEMYPNAGVALTEIDKQPNNNNDNSFYMGYKYEGASEAHYNDLKAMVENEKCSPYGQYTCLAFFPDTACYCHYTLYDKFADEDNEEFILGDANSDSNITVADAVAILQYLGNTDKYPLTPQQKINADCYNTGDGITPNDALAIQQYDAKLITHF